MPSETHNQNTPSRSQQSVQPKNMQSSHVEYPPADRLLRWITIWSFVPAIAFLIPHGALTNMPCPAIGLIPQGLSACFGVFHIYRRLNTRGIDIAVDLFLAIFLIGTLIPGWVLISENHSYFLGIDTVSSTMVGTYGTVPLMLNLCVLTSLPLMDMSPC